jgi:hypothetical protein
MMKTNEANTRNLAFRAGFLLGVSALALLAIGASPRYLEELRIGGGYGESVDGGIDFEADGDMLTDGNVTLGGDLSVNGGDVTTASGNLALAPAGGTTNVTGALVGSGSVNAEGGTMSAGETATTRGIFYGYGDGNATGAVLRLEPGALKQTYTDYWQLAAEYNTGNFEIYAAKGGGTSEDVITIDDQTRNLTVHKGLTLANGETFTRGTFVTETVVAYNSSSPVTLLDVDDGYVIVWVYAKVTTAWDGTGTVNLGDGGDPDGYMSNAKLDLTNTGWRGGSLDDLGAFMDEDVGSAEPDTVPRHHIYSGADTVDATVVQGTTTQGAMTVYVVARKLK